MTKEIKDIIEYLKDDSMFIADEDGTRKEITLDESKLLLNYITNLQEENERLKEEIMWLKDTIQDKNDCIGAYDCIIEDRDERIDKATNYILENICCDTRVYTKNEIVYKVVDILRGDE